VDLKIIPGVGKSIKNDLNILGVYKVNDLKKRNPQEMYDTLCKISGTKIDKCILYVFICVIYFSNNPKGDPELLKWWYWKDRTNAKQNS